MSKEKNIHEILRKLERDTTILDLMLDEVYCKRHNLFKPPKFRSCWTKNGWKTELVTRRERFKYTSLSTRMPYHREEWDSRLNEDLTSFDSIADEIQAGTPLGAIDNLSGPQRQLVQSPDKFYVNKSNSRMFVKTDEETQAIDGQWGYDTEDSEEETSVVRDYLIRHSLVEEEASSARVLEVAYETTFCLLVDIPEEVVFRISQLVEEGTEEAEQELDRLFGPYLTNDLASDACGSGYSAPRTKFEFVFNPPVSEVSQAAQDRKAFFMKLFGEAASVSTALELFGMNKNYNWTIESEADEYFATDDNSKAVEPSTKDQGFYGKIRGMYKHDQELNAKWSVEGEDSAFIKARNKYIERWYDQGRGDDKKLDAYLWLIFDRRANVVEPVYRADTGVLVSERKVYQDSYWMQRRTRALKDLFLTNKQWRAIYAILKNVQRRINCNRNPDQVCLNGREKVRALYKQIETLDDLKEHIILVQKRTVKDNGNVTLSLLDEISMADEHKWRNTCAQKRKRLLKQLIQTKFIEDSVTMVEGTEYDEVAVSCPHLGCGCMAIGKPSRAILDNGGSCTFVECDGCGRMVLI